MVGHRLTMVDSRLTLVNLGESVRLSNEFWVIVLVGSTRNPLKRFPRWFLGV